MTDRKKSPRDAQKAAPLSAQVMHRILREMQSGAYQHMDRLPPEVEIAGSLGVSRTVVRDSLAIMEREGYVTRKHGLGTIINRHVLSVATRIDLEKEFLEMIRDAGFAPSVSALDICEYRADAELARLMRLEEGDEIIRIDRLISADGTPSIFCHDFLAKKRIVKRTYSREDMERPVFDFLKEFCDTDVYLDLTEIRAVNADEDLARRMAIPVGAAVLLLKERGYDIMGNLVLYAHEFYRDDILKHTILRLKI